jgi:mannose-6-phosphate isomerase-like protein (cupin superfamily)
VGHLRWLTTRRSEGTNPSSLHQWEHEFYHVLSGRLRFYCGEQTLDAQTRDYIFIPQGAPHTFDILTTEAHAIIMVTSVDGTADWTACVTGTDS